MSLSKNMNEKLEISMNELSHPVCPNNEQHIVKKEGDNKYCMVCGVINF